MMPPPPPFFLFLIIVLMEYFIYFGALNAYLVPRGSKIFYTLVPGLCCTT